ncbi:MAG: Peptidyl-tRNA hydrolase [Candidatus Curtissbacteria bacterium GW2011_GWA1_40_47]|uniref:Peptidyl-tRNA hydrolase n=1 Tax=Candidatus Curtissbacteria bacterium RIFOXYA1_FULL_41_14 TaxID=1797737 RepID=A0A1F5HG78_9BACT|nr:MAG: Peptidyl-tRNA hydrolase [Candidatus Curtissbacteria bacterium GW2011_GWB1_40_28]KKR60066.1 MAG: Peptidyl-tRNA hydrolase [Candidatus Curtissbacteria bacterium GW2011_GWA2_40_31]KKR60934.1 MAG: Peptidyl-tRNA hydrolase [Microgenomates group bacterium GW2011_GWC1_40_35]KKR65757.1 MAG: Peptidyl-tRNA hydrolase [Candidatus Curtissbacteria bacterium GW2011_GWA1_40_47]KKR76310.1 MAG: Peptidyl-tRNA hydrolase [Candidatus Curtissbacteria bacterium GW2011_GWD1_40_8]KKS01380.1 MAG: Peptidyl-tRNA hyd
MKLIVGLGNPGVKFEKTRHNLGFMVMDFFAGNKGLSWQYNSDFSSHYAKDAELVIAKPTTYVNQSGIAVASICRYFRVDLSDLLVIHDDLDLPFGKIRLTYGSSSAGHRGIESIIENLGMEFTRLRIGIGRPLESIDPEKYVLQKFSTEENKQLPKIIEKSTEAIKSYLDLGIDAAMNRYN